MQTIVTESDTFEFEGSVHNLLVVRVFKMIGGEARYASVYELNDRADLDHSTITHFTVNGQSACFGQYIALRMPERLLAGRTTDERWDAVRCWYGQRAIEAQHIAEAALGVPVDGSHPFTISALAV